MAREEDMHQITRMMHSKDTGKPLKPFLNRSDTFCFMTFKDESGNSIDYIKQGLERQTVVII